MVHGESPRMRVKSFVNDSDEEKEEAEEAEEEWLVA